MSSNHLSVSEALHGHIEIARDPRLTEEATMRKYRVVIEDEKTGQEYAAFAGLTRARAEVVAAYIRDHGDADLKAGRLPPRTAPRDGVYRRVRRP